MEMSKDDLIRIIEVTAKTTAVETMRVFSQYGETIPKNKVVKELGKRLFNQAIESNKLKPVRSGRITVFSTKDFLAYKAFLFNY